jgi:hypothetical protein
MKNIALTLVVLPLGSTAFGESTETKNTRNEIAPAAYTQEAASFTVYAHLGFVYVNNPTETAAYVYYGITYLLPGTGEQTVYRWVYLEAGKTFVDHVNGYYALFAWVRN